MRYKFCPQCGNKLTEKIAGDDGKVPFCESCGTLWFDTFASCVIIMIANEYNEIALLHQDYLSDKFATFVAGYMKPGETAEETAVREAEEELGVKVDRLEYAGTYWFDDNDMLMHGFIGFVKKSDFTLSNEVDRAEWVPYNETPQKLFPERPGNAQFPIYRKYLEITGLSNNT